ncbi:hypothetical protein TVAG_113920 [Trichomonas vaginalis G3]|uniref:Uncharacterized protein n=1 Tax=Trichomonas vaginalis (strain ATCC PRA-98 / G3) TaxID=412133 RepID=A2DNP5_TRIV3|nr:hypothetical protein TVAGG3_0608010 [Trichomonas vaginalis G3]EAY18048.1 hypothetical protein TVAG_113920 [Trichomonas vaginalis G3]KAI5524386.1 hypothetical protein TVAGG3_0608010 [Trichomonas vaginalis G3]|eukprot:XP_001579034.1 hypothetical protein [Trichomonas vaginalis G3]
MKYPVFAQILCFRNPGDNGYTMVEVDKGNIKFDTARIISIEEFRKIGANLRKDASEAAQAHQLQSKAKNKKTSQCPPLNIEQPKYVQAICPVPNIQSYEGGLPPENLYPYPFIISPMDPNFSNFEYDFDLDPSTPSQPTSQEFSDYF